MSNMDSTFSYFNERSQSTECSELEIYYIYLAVVPYSLITKIADVSRMGGNSEICQYIVHVCPWWSFPWEDTLFCWGRPYLWKISSRLPLWREKVLSGNYLCPVHRAGRKSVKAHPQWLTIVGAESQEALQISWVLLFLWKPYKILFWHATSAFTGIRLQTVLLSWYGSDMSGVYCGCCR